MKHANALLLAVVSTFVLWACGSSGGPYERYGKGVYDFDFDFLWEEAQAELKRGFRDLTLDREARTITTEWEMRLAPYRSMGQRHRVIVAFEDAGEKKWKVKATQESESNEETEHPLKPDEASWTKMRSDGALAEKFLSNFEARMNPNDAWRRRAAR
jgi:hypothetical protein